MVPPGVSRRQAKPGASRSREDDAGRSCAGDIQALVRKVSRASFGAHFRFWFHQRDKLQEPLEAQSILEAQSMVTLQSSGMPTRAVRRQAPRSEPMAIAGVPPGRQRQRTLRSRSMTATFPAGLVAGDRTGAHCIRTAPRGRTERRRGEVATAAVTCLPQFVTPLGWPVIC